MAIPSLLGSYIDQTYPRLVQVSGSEFADGLGNPISIGISGGTDTYIPLWSGSNALTSSYLVQSFPNTLLTRFPGAETGLMIDYANDIYKFGDYNNIVSGTQISMDNSNQQIRAISSGSATFIAQVHNNTRGGVYLGNPNYFTSNEAGLYDVGGDAPLAVLAVEPGDIYSYRYSPSIKVDGSSNLTSIAYGLDITGSIAISGSATLNGVTLKPASVDGIDLSSAAYTISSWGVYRVTVGDNTFTYNLNLPDPARFPGYEISIINSDQTNQFQFGTNAPYKLSGTSGWSLMEPNIMMILKSIGGKWIGPKIPQS